MCERISVWFSLFLGYHVLFNESELRLNFALHLSIATRPPLFCLPQIGNQSNTRFYPTLWWWTWHLNPSFLPVLLPFWKDGISLLHGNPMALCRQLEHRYNLYCLPSSQDMPEGAKIDILVPTTSRFQKVKLGGKHNFSICSYKSLSFSLKSLSGTGLSF